MSHMMLGSGEQPRDVSVHLTINQLQFLLQQVQESVSIKLTQLHKNKTGNVPKTVTSKQVNDNIYSLTCQIQEEKTLIKCLEDALLINS